MSTMMAVILIYKINKTLSMQDGNHLVPLGMYRTILNNTKKPWEVQLQYSTCQYFNKWSSVLCTIVNDDNLNRVNRLTVLSLLDKDVEVFSGKLGTFTGEMHLQPSDSVHSVAMSTSWTPIAIRVKLKTEHYQMQKLCVITHFNQGSCRMEMHQNSVPVLFFWRLKQIPL